MIYKYHYYVIMTSLMQASASIASGSSLDLNLLLIKHLDSIIDTQNETDPNLLMYIT